jgi:hypothetical protein
VNLVSLTLFVALVAGAYLAWIFVPLWLDDLDVLEAVAAGVSQLTAEGKDTVAVQKEVAKRLAKVGFHWEDQDGKQVEVIGLGVDPDDVQVERMKDGRKARLTVDYGRTVKLKPLERYWTIQFHTTREGVFRP